ncbi:Hypothetical predicted protein, partial [Paramuricea clavata]
RFNPLLLGLQKFSITQQTTEAEVCRYIVRFFPLNAEISVSNTDLRDKNQNIRLFDLKITNLLETEDIND